MIYLSGLRISALASIYSGRRTEPSASRHWRQGRKFPPASIALTGRPHTGQVLDDQDGLNTQPSRDGTICAPPWRRTRVVGGVRSAAAFSLRPQKNARLEITSDAPASTLGQPHTGGPSPKRGQNGNGTPIHRTRGAPKEPAGRAGAPPHPRGGRSAHTASRLAFT